MHAPRPSPSRLLAPALPTSLLALGLASPLSADQVYACGGPAATEQISLALSSSAHALVDVWVLDGEPGEKRCFASVEVPLSAFPTARLSIRPADVARSLRDVAEKLGATECTVHVNLANDTGEPLAEHEHCLQETFRFGERKHWSTGREAFCWEPEPDVETASNSSIP